MLFLPPPILALDLWTIIQAIFLLVVLASGAIRLVADAAKAQKRAGGNQLPNAQQQPKDGTQLEIEEFLRRASEGIGEQKKKKDPKPAPRRQRIEVLDDEDEPVRKPLSAPLREPEVELIAVEPITRQGIDRGESVAEHVTVHMQNEEFRSRAAQMGYNLSQTDERLEERLHEKFDHQLGSLRSRSLDQQQNDDGYGPVVLAPSSADELVAMLSTPQGMRQAILMNEILSRPTDRW